MFMCFGLSVMYVTTVAAGDSSMCSVLQYALVLGASHAKCDCRRQALLQQHAQNTGCTAVFHGTHYVYWHRFHALHCAAAVAAAMLCSTGVRAPRNQRFACFSLACRFSWMVRL
jgi:hypothetical protein